MNSEGYSDPTADKAVGRVTAAKRAADEARIRTLMKALRAVCECAGFEIAARVVLRDKESGRIYK